MTLPSTSDYEMRIVEPLKALEPKSYGVYNKHTDILEHKDSMFHRTYDAMKKLQEHYEMAIDDIEKTESAEKARSVKLVT